jgi:RNA polymerase sigma-70 factor (ECF subfamily)
MEYRCTEAAMPIPSPETSLSLLDRFRGPSPAGDWPRLVRRYSPLLQSWLSAAGLQPADCDDLTQRALEVLVRRLPYFKHNGRPGAFRAWLRGIVSNLMREFWRARPTAESAQVLEQLADSSTALSRLWDEQHDRHVLRMLLDEVRPEFTETTWLAFCRVTFDDVPARVVARELGLTVNAVHIAKSRVLTRLRRVAEAGID